MDLAVYVHFPWCLQRCPYCDFATEAINPARIPHARYADAVVLGTKAKGVVVNQFFRFMNQLVIYQNLSRKRITHIDLMAIKMATMLKEFDFDKPNNNL